MYLKGRSGSLGALQAPATNQMKNLKDLSGPRVGFEEACSGLRSSL
jgi:hypothetical protein